MADILLLSLLIAPVGLIRAAVAVCSVAELSAGAPLEAPPLSFFFFPATCRLADSTSPPQVSPAFLFLPHLSASASLTFPKGFWGDCVFERKRKTKNRTSDVSRSDCYGKLPDLKITADNVQADVSEVLLRLICFVCVLDGMQTTVALFMAGTRWVNYFIVALIKTWKMLTC